MKRCPWFPAVLMLLGFADNAYAGVVQGNARAVTMELAWSYSTGRQRPHALRLGVSNLWTIGRQCTYWRPSDCVPSGERPAEVFPLVGMQLAAEWRGGDDLVLLAGPRGGFGSINHGDGGFLTRWSVEGEVEAGIALRGLDPRLRLGGRAKTGIPPCFGPVVGEDNVVCTNHFPTVLARVGWEALQPGDQFGLLLGAGTDFQLSEVAWID